MTTLMDKADTGAVESGAGDTPTFDVATLPRLRRRPLLALGGLALVVVGALLAVWAWTATSQTVEVVGVRDTVLRGELIGAEDLIAVQVSPDPALRTVPGSQLQKVVGQRAARDLLGGSLLTPEATVGEVTPVDGFSVVGLALGPGFMPGEPLLTGDAVRVVATPSGQVSGSTDIDTEGPGSGTFPAEVARVDVSDGGQVVVSVIVDEAAAPEIARWAATGRVALVLDSRQE